MRLSCLSGFEEVGKGLLVTLPFSLAVEVLLPDLGCFLSRDDHSLHRLTIIYVRFILTPLLCSVIRLHQSISYFFGSLGGRSCGRRGTRGLKFGGFFCPGLTCCEPGDILTNKKTKTESKEI